MKSLLLDADIVIHLHELNLWDALINNGKTSICIASTVTLESLFFKNAYGQKSPIKLSQYFENNTLQEKSATIEEMQQIMGSLPKGFMPQLDAGELESLVILKNESADGMFFCTGDNGAIVMLALLNLAANGISLEKTLKQFGMERKLNWTRSEKHFQRCLREGKERYIYYKKLD